MIRRNAKPVPALDPEVDGLSSWTLPELCRVIEERFAKRLHPASLSRVVCEWGSPGRRRASATPHPIRVRRRRFKKGAFRRRRRCKAGISGQTHHAVVRR
jgi:hypothetical protein